MEAEVKGNLAYSAGHYTDAIGHYTEAINHEPNKSSHYYNRSICYYNLYQYSNGLPDAIKYVDMNPNWYLGYEGLGQAYTGLKRYDEAVSAYKKGLELDPNNAGLKSALAYVEIMIKAKAEFDEARSYEKKADDHPTSTTSWADDLVNMKKDLQDKLGNILNSLSASATTLKQRFTLQNASSYELLESHNNVDQVDDGFSVKTALSVLNRMVEDGLIVKGGELWCAATDLFEDARKREMFISMPDDDGRIAWLKHVTNKKDLICGGGGGGDSAAVPAAKEKRVNCTYNKKDLICRKKKEEPNDEDHYCLPLFD